MECCGWWPAFNTLLTLGHVSALKTTFPKFKKWVVYEIRCRVWEGIHVGKMRRCLREQLSEFCTAYNISTLWPLDFCKTSHIQDIPSITLQLVLFMQAQDVSALMNDFEELEMASIFTSRIHHSSQPSFLSKTTSISTRLNVFLFLSLCFSNPLSLSYSTATVSVSFLPSIRSLSSPDDVNHVLPETGYQILNFFFTLLTCLYID